MEILIASIALMSIGSICLFVGISRLFNLLVKTIIFAGVNAGKSQSITFNNQHESVLIIVVGILLMIVGGALLAVFLI